MDKIADSLNQMESHSALPPTPFPSLRRVLLFRIVLPTIITTTFPSFSLGSHAFSFQRLRILRGARLLSPPARRPGAAFVPRSAGSEKLAGNCSRVRLLPGPGLPATPLAAAAAAAAALRAWPSGRDCQGAGLSAAPENEVELQPAREALPTSLPLDAALESWRGTDGHRSPAASRLGAELLPPPLWPSVAFAGGSPCEWWDRTVRCRMLPVPRAERQQPLLWPGNAEPPALPWIWMVPSAAGLFRIRGAAGVVPPPLLLSSPPHPPPPPPAPLLQGLSGWQLPCDPFLPLMAPEHHSAVPQLPFVNGQWMFGTHSPAIGFSPSSNLEFVPLFPHVYTTTGPPHSGKSWIEKRLPNCKIFLNNAFALDSAWIHPEEVRIYQGHEKPLVMSNQVAVALSRPAAAPRPLPAMVLTPQPIPGGCLKHAGSNQTIAFAAAMVSVDAEAPQGPSTASVQPCHVLTLSPIKIPVLTSPFPGRKPELATVADFLQAMLRQYGDPLREEKAVAALQRIEQGNRSTREYATEFMGHCAAARGWNEVMKYTAFKNGLNANILDRAPKKANNEAVWNKADSNGEEHTLDQPPNNPRRTDGDMGCLSST
ncbi:transcription elongation regulator 1-like protein [Heteronotia binoei]|uniref:transcription elongation regulator 1-like protein n=1 Tax=Heteronotia binoei TaxID=13085 RepID=UPI002931CC31|nr:transcription elongation regulator 1-like protein [Heteronotia binoei]